MSSTSCCHSESPLFVSVVWAVWLHLRAPPAYYSFLLILLLILNFPLFPLLCCITLQQNRGGQRGFSTSPLTSVPIHRCARPLWTVSLYAREEWLSKIVSRVGRPEQNKKNPKMRRTQIDTWRSSLSWVKSCPDCAPWRPHLRSVTSLAHQPENTNLIAYNIWNRH